MIWDGDRERKKRLTVARRGGASGLTSEGLHNGIGAQHRVPIITLTPPPSLGSAITISSLPSALRAICGSDVFGLINKAAEVSRLSNVISRKRHRMVLAPYFLTLRMYGKADAAQAGDIIEMAICNHSWNGHTVQVKMVGLFIQILRNVWRETIAFG